MYYKLKEAGLVDNVDETIGLEFLDLDRIIATSNSHHSSNKTTPVVSSRHHSSSNLQQESNASENMESAKAESPESTDRLLAKVRADFMQESSDRANSASCVNQTTSAANIRMSNLSGDFTD